MGYNSTIITRKKICVSCGKSAYWFSKKRCADCARIEDTMARMEAESERMIQEEDLSGLIADADAIFSRYVRLSVADKSGICECYICGKKIRWQDAQCMHYIKRGCLYLRYSLDNCKCGCKECNEYKSGNLLEYGKKIDADSPGATEILYQYSVLVYKPTRQEIKDIILEYTLKVKNINNGNTG